MKEPLALRGAHQRRYTMKANLRMLILAGAAALIAGTALPAHATISGSNPRPPAGSSGTSMVMATILTVLGY